MGSEIDWPYARCVPNEFVIVLTNLESLAAADSSLVENAIHYILILVQKVNVEVVKSERGNLLLK